MFKKLKDYGSAWVEGTKAALDPANIKAGIQGAIQLSYSMPTPNVNTIGVKHAGEPGALVDAAAALAQREDVVQGWSASSASGVWTDRVYTATPLVQEIITALHLSGLEPAQVFGVFPSTEVVHPAQVGTNPPQSYTEWCIVHSAGPGVGARTQQAIQARQEGQRQPADQDATIVSVAMARDRRWVDRPNTAPLLFDEEAAALLAWRAGIDPAQCFGLARLLVWAQFGPGAPGFEDVAPTGMEGQWYMGASETSRSVTVDPLGVRLLWKALPGQPPPLLPALAPVPFPAGQALPAHVELLDWSPIAQVVQPVWTTRPADPTGYPRLPATPTELLESYLRIVGVRPEDTYGVSTSVASQQSGSFTQAGLASDRGQACSLLTAVYRDRPEYQQGRARFEQYRAQVLGVPLGVERPVIGKFERLAYSGMKQYVRYQVGSELYQELGGDDMYDSSNYPYVAGPAPMAPK